MFKAGAIMLLVGILASAPLARADLSAPVFPRGKGESCVEPVDIMRKQHMEFLLHQRDDTLHRGIRTTRHSLVGCIDCHVHKSSDGGYIPVDAPGQFCESCHSYTATRIDCFECHATVPYTQAQNLDRSTEQLKLLSARLHRFLALDTEQ